MKHRPNGSNRRLTSDSNVPRGTCSHLRANMLLRRGGGKRRERAASTSTSSETILHNLMFVTVHAGVSSKCAKFSNNCEGFSQIFRPILVLVLTARSLRLKERSHVTKFSPSPISGPLLFTIMSMNKGP